LTIAVLISTIGVLLAVPQWRRNKDLALDALGTLSKWPSSAMSHTVRDHRGNVVTYVYGAQLQLKARATALNQYNSGVRMVAVWRTMAFGSGFAGGVALLILMWRVSWLRSTERAWHRATARELVGRWRFDGIPSPPPPARWYKQVSI
jgi:hypothetical protein